MRSVKFALLTGILAGMLVAGAGYADDPLFDVVIEHGRVMDPESGLDRSEERRVGKECA